MYSNRIETKALVILQMAEGYRTGKMSLEKAREALNEPMRYLRPIEHVALKEQLSIALESVKTEVEGQRLAQLFSTYFPPPYDKLPLGHPICHYYLENVRLKEVLLEADQLLEGNSTVADWKRVYDRLQPYHKHLERNRKNLYPKLEKQLSEGLEKKLKEMENEVKRQLSDMADQVEKELDHLFLLDQQQLIKNLSLLMELEEKGVYTRALEVLSSETWQVIRVLDDACGYAYISVSEPFDATATSPFTRQPSHVPWPIESEAFLEALTSFDSATLALFDPKGRLLCRRGTALSASDNLEEKVTQWFLNKDNKRLKGLTCLEGRDYLVSYTKIPRETDYFILKTMEAHSTQYLDLDALAVVEDYEKDGLTPEDERTLQEIFKAYPQLEASFFDLYEELKDLKNDPMGTELVQNATVKMLATALSIAPYELALKMNSLLERV